MGHPEELKYTAEHEWARVSGPAGPDSPGGNGGQTVRIGITSFAQEALGDIVFVTVPDEGASVEAGQSVGEVESTKSVSELYAPVSGTVVATNPAVQSQPELINSDPYGDGWILEIAVADPAQLDGLLDAASYEQQIAAG